MTSPDPTTEQLTQARHGFRKALEKAVGQGDFGAVQAALGESRVLPGWITLSMVCQAAEQGDPAIVGAILAATRGWVLPLAIKDLVEKRDERAILAVAHCGQKDGVQALIRYVGESGDVSLIIQLMGECPGDLIDWDEALGLALTGAVTQGRWEMASYLVSVVSAEETQRQAQALLYRMVSSAAAPMDLLEQLLAIVEETGDHLREALVASAAVNGCPRFMEFLMKSPCVEKEKIAAAAVLATVHVRNEVLAFLVPRVTAQDLGDAFTKQMDEKRDMGVAGATDLLALGRGMDYAGQFLRTEDLGAWVERFSPQLTPMTCARMRAFRTELDDARMGSIASHPHRARSRP